MVKNIVAGCVLAALIFMLLLAYAQENLGDFLTEQGGDNSRKVLRRRGWTFPELSECRKKWEGRFPGWKWRNPKLNKWQVEVGDDDEERAASEGSRPDEEVPF